MKRPGFHHFNSFTIKTGLISIITLAFSTFTVKSQITFEKTISSINNQTGEDIIQTRDGSYAVIGAQGGAYYQWPMDHFLFYKLDQTGSVVKMTLFADGFDASGGSEIIQTEDNGFIACGSGNGLLYEPYLVKYNPVGDTNWTKVINQESGYNVSLSICQTYDHGFALCGTLSLAAMIVIRTDASGEKIWQKVFDDPDCYDESAECIIETNDSSLVICGYRNDSLALIKLNPEGDSIWMKCFTEQPLRGYSLKQTDDQGFIITGSTEMEAGNSDVLLLKTNENGETIWEKHIGGIVNDFAVDLDITSDKGFIICGTTRGNNDLNSDVYLIKTDQNGDTIWTKKFGGNLYEEGRGIDCTMDGGYIISGYKYLNDTLYNIYLIKTDTQGMVGIVTEENKDMLKMLSVFPNPCSEMLNVECSMLDAGSYYELIVYDTFGLQVLSPTLKGGGREGGKAAGDRNWTSSRIDVSSLPSGVYFISVLEDGKRIAGGKFILER